MAQTEYKNDYFNFFTKQVQEIKQKSVKKIVYLGMSIGCGIAITFGAINGIGTMYNHYSTNTAATVSNNISTIKNMKPEEFNHFLNYLKFQQSAYDEKVALVSSAIVNAEHEWVNVRKKDSRYVQDADNAYNLKSALVNHKFKFQRLIIRHHAVYTHIQNNQLQEISHGDLKVLLNDLQYYKSHTFFHNTDLESSIHYYLYNNEPGNNEYNINYKIYEQFETLNTKVEIKFANIKQY